MESDIEKDWNWNFCLRDILHLKYQTVKVRALETYNSKDV